MSSSNDNVKIFKNPNRDLQQKHSVYVPNYVQRDIQPQKHEKLVENTKSIKPKTILNKSVPYANSTVKPVMGSQIPNIGNNMEITWSGVDAEFVDDVSGLDLNHKMIDNNDFYADPKINDMEKIEESSYNFDYFHALQSGVAVVIVGSDIVFTGSLDDSQEIIKLLIFGEHEYCQGAPIDPDIISCFIKASIKTGVFVQV